MRILRAAAFVALVLWLVAVITMFWTTWDFAGPDTDRVFPGNRLLRSVAAALGSSWGYALVAVLAYTASCVLGALRSELLPAWSAEG